MDRNLPSGTVTFLFTDVEGSTRLLGELGEERYAAALASHREVIRGACAAHGGVEVDTQGDAFFFAFGSAPGALQAASDLTETLASGPISVRVGLHTGTPLLTEEGYVGHDLHFAARVAASGHGGQVLVSAATASLVDLALTDLGEHRLKDIGEAVSIFQLGDRQFPPLKTISNTNLPRPASSFVGRGDELQQVIARIEAGARLLTLTGPGGTGKTRLALEVAMSLVSEYKAGVFWVGLAALRDPALVTETISQTLGAKDGLQEHIGERELLLLLDNLEQVIEAAPDLTALLEACPNLTLLVTSRELLRISGEVEYSVPPLAQPEAVSLFCERAQIEPSPEIAELCSRLDSLPLAVELAAARTKALSPAQILERLSSRLDLLKGGRDADPRQQTLRATIEWSYDLLSPEEQQLFARLSVFAGGCTLEAAEEVAEADLDTLQSLVEKSLVRHSDERYWMLETIREYGFEALGERRRWAISARHAEHFLVLAERTCARLGDRDEAELLDRLEADHDNLRAAFAWATEGNRLDLAAALAAALWRFWHEHTHVAEGRAALTEILERCHDLSPGVEAEVMLGAALLTRDHGALDEAGALYEELINLCRANGDEGRLTSALGGLGVVAVYSGESDRAADLLEESLQRRRAQRDERSIANALNDLGCVEVERGHVERAAGLFAECLAIQRRLGSAQGLAFVLHSSACLALKQGRKLEADASFREALGHFLEIGDRMGVAHCIEALGSVAAAGDYVDRAVRLWGAGEALRNAIGIEIDPNEGTIRAPLSAAAESLLGPQAFARLWATGNDMTPEQAVAYAVSTVD